MSRSRRRHPFLKICGRSDKLDKRHANRKFRRLTKARINVDQHPPEHIREVSDTWSFNSDGLAYYLHIANSTDQEDKEELKCFMRK